MATSTIHKLAKLDGPSEQKKQILADLGDMSEFELLDDDILIATYVDSAVAASGKRADGTSYQILKPDQTTSEARWQGKVALVVAIGPTAFSYHANGQPYEGKKLKVGDWVVIHPADGREIFLRNASKGKETSQDYVACRRIHWKSILMRVKDPRRIY